MSSASISLSASPSTTSRGRAIEKPSPSSLNLARNDAVLAPTFSEPQNLRISNLNIGVSVPAFSDPGHLRLSNRNAVSNKPLVNLLESTTPPPLRTPASVRKAAKPRKSKRLSVVSVLNFVLLLVIGGLVQVLRNLSDGNDGVAPVDLIAADFVGKYDEMRLFVKKTTRMIQVQVDVIDRKVEKYAESLREEIERRDIRIEEKLADVRRDLKKVVEERFERLVSREELEEYLKGEEMRRDGVSLEDVKAYASEVVEKEIEKHAAGGVGRVDYALGATGGRVMKHSRVYVGMAGRVWGVMFVKSLFGRFRVHKSADKVLTPSFGEPGSCFPLKGSSGYVTIRLRTAIVPEAITLEHVAESVAYDRSSAPKDCRVYGWSAAEGENKKMLLSEFTYDLKKSNVQTFEVDSVGSRVVDTIRLDFSSNHGSSSHTCLYRLRVHGFEPGLSMLAAVP